MIPIIYDNPILSGNGYGRMADAISCTVTHEINGQYELAMEYPVTGQHYDRIEAGMVLFAAPDPVTAEQPFRIYRVTRPLNGVVTVYARHIAYDMSGISVLPFTASSLSEAFSLLPNQCVPSCPFTFTTTRSVASRIRTVTPMPLWSLLGGVAGSFLDVYGGEWDFDGLTASLPSSLGQDNGVSVRYGKNMTELEQDITVESTWAAVLPFWYNEETGQLVKTDQPVPVQGAFGSRVLTLDFSEEWEEAPTVAQLTARTEQYITANKIGEPQVAWKVNMAMLDQSEEYKGLAILERVQLGDTVTVVYEPYGIDIKARAVMIEYDVLAERYKSINLGRVKQNLAKIVASTPAEITAAVNAAKSALERAIDVSTDFITHGTGYMRFIYNDDKVLQEIVSLDNPDINLAQSVWRWNNGGFGHSSTGYAGPYTVAMTQDGAIVADFITSGTMSADRIAAGTITISKMDQAAQDEIAKGQQALEAADDAQATADGAATAAGNAQATANGAATAAATAQAKADSALVTTVPVYYRASTAAEPSAPSAAVTSTAYNVDDTWSLQMQIPKNGATYYTCEQNTDGSGRVTFTPVRQLRNATYVAGWAMANNATYIDGASIYTGTVTADKIAANEVFTQKLTATNFVITGGSIQIDTQPDSWDIIKLNSGSICSEYGPSGINVFNPNYSKINKALFGTRYSVGPHGAASCSLYVRNITPSGDVSYESLLQSTGIYFNNKLTDTTESASLSVYNGANLSLTKGTASISLNPGAASMWLNGASKYSALIWPDSNGAGRFVLGDGASTKWRTELTNSGLVFRDASDNVTAAYNSAVESAEYTPYNDTLTFLSSSRVYCFKTGTHGNISVQINLQNGGDFAAGTDYTIMTLPEQYRPAYKLRQMVPDASGATACLISIDTTGAVTLYRYAASAAFGNGWIRAEIPVIFANP